MVLSQPGDLGPEHQRRRNVEHPVLDVHVGVAHAGAGHPHDLVTCRRRIGPILERQRHSDSPQHRDSHDATLATTGDSAAAGLHL
jgi:hypothetical protein